MTHATFGIELEFILATVPPGTADPQPLDLRQVHNLDNTKPPSLEPTSNPHFPESPTKHSTILNTGKVAPM